LKQEAAMFAIRGIGTSAAAPRMRCGPAARDEPDAPTTASRALIPVAAPFPGGRPATLTRRPLAAFLAHLIATQTQAPQTRVRRRAEPEEAMAVYGIASVRAGKAGRKFARNA
jgi:hypothetical protein